MMRRFAPIGLAVLILAGCSGGTVQRVIPVDSSTVDTSKMEDLLTKIAQNTYVTCRNIAYLAMKADTGNGFSTRKPEACPGSFLP